MQGVNMARRVTQLDLNSWLVTNKMLANLTPKNMQVCIKMTFFLLMFVLSDGTVHPPRNAKLASGC